YLVKDGNNSYMTVGNVGISKKEARKQVIKKTFKNYGIFSAENLAMYTKFEYKMGELRAILKELEDEGFLTKGYFIKGDSTLYWMLKNDIGLIGTTDFKRRFVLTPDDGLWSYMQMDIRNLWGLGVCFVVFDNTKMIAAFKGKVKKGELKVTGLKGDNAGWKTIKEFVSENNLTIKEEVEKIDDWEVMSLYEKMKGKATEK
ncbi:MAG: hypothetical protein KAI64_00400, partial [Thermoplasmata archaeon]|nr:hypothetical protein [Thermoplasmata archaeon]